MFRIDILMLSLVEELTNEEINFESNHFQKCQLCKHCMNNQLRDILRTSYEEHISRRNMRRILPHTTHKPEYSGLLHSELDILLTLWFDDRCRNDKTWCF